MREGFSPSNPDMRPPSEEEIEGHLLPPKIESRTEKIREHAVRQDILVRERVVSDAEAETMMAAFDESKELFEKLRDEYGVRVVAMEHLGGKNEEGETVIFNMVDRIEGQDLEKIESLPLEARDELEDLYKSLTKYYGRSWKENLKYWSDCNNSQFVYGNKYGEKDRHFYLVDVEAHFHRPGENELFPVSWPIVQICRGIADAEKKLGANTRLEAARIELSALVEEMLEREPDSAPLLEARAILS